MHQEIAGLIAQYGLWLVFANVLLTQVGLPLPAVPTMIVAGALAVAGGPSIGGVLAVSLLACFMADFAWYLAGRRFGEKVMKLLCSISLSPDSCVRQSELGFERWGGGMLLVAKFVPGLSTVAPPIAGAMKLPVAAFLMYDGIGSAAWAGVAIGAGVLLHAEVVLVLDHLQDMGAAAIALVGALLAAYIAFKWLQRQRLFRTLRMARIGVDELHGMMTAGDKPVVIDVRSDTARRIDGRAIPGAVTIDPDRLESGNEPVPADGEIIVYCNCPNEASAARVAKMLMKRGYKHVRPLHGGLDAWADAGYAVEDISSRARAGGQEFS